MEGSSGASGSDNASGSVPPQVTLSQTLGAIQRGMELLKNEKEFLENQNKSIMKTTDLLKDAKAIWDALSPKQTVLQRLYDELIAVSRKVKEYHHLRRNRNISVSENIESFHRFTEIDEQTQVLTRMLGEYEKKLSRAEGIIEGFISDMQSHMRSLGDCLDVISQARTLSDLVQIQIPNLEWFEATPDSKIESLAVEWEEMHLDERISDCLDQLKRLLLPPEPEMGVDLE